MGKSSLLDALTAVVITHDKALTTKVQGEGDVLLRHSSMLWQSSQWRSEKNLTTKGALDGFRLQAVRPRHACSSELAGANHQ